MPRTKKNPDVEQTAEVATQTQEPKKRGRKPREKRIVVSPGISHGNRLNTILKCMIDEHVTIADLAEQIGITRQGMTLRFKADDCRLSDMEEMAEALGYTFKWEFIKKEENK